MSLDVSLYIDGASGSGSGIFVREAGEVREISRAEWDEKFPGREPVVAVKDPEEVFSANITHNLGKMADEAGLYNIVWRPEEWQIKKAKELIEPLRRGLKTLKEMPDYFRRFDASNGWGTYDQFVPWVERYLQACEEYPDARIEVSR